MILDDNMRLGKYFNLIFPFLFRFYKFQQQYTILKKQQKQEKKT